MRPANLLHAPGYTRAHTAWRLALVLLIGTCAANAEAAYHALEEIPTESALNGAVEALLARHGTPSGFPHTRPWTLAEAKDLLRKLLDGGCDCEGDPAFVRLSREVEGSEQPSPFLRIVEDNATVELSPYFKLGHREGTADSPSVVRDHRVGVAFAGGWGPGLLLFADYYAGTSSPDPHGNPIGGSTFSLVEGAEFNAWFDRAYVASALGPVTARAGHTWLRWGPGRSGTLGLYDGSLALDTAELRWRILSGAQLTWFVAWLDALGQEYLAGHRLELRLGEGVVAGVSELARFNGDVHVPLYFVPVIGFSLREKQVSRFSDSSADTGRVFSKNNVLWTADLSWRVRPGFLAYGEVVVDDFSLSSVYRPPLIGLQIGARLSRLLSASDAGLASVEYTRISNFTYSTWHRHDFASDGFPLAYPHGPDVETILAEFEWNRGADWTFAASTVLLQKGEGRLGEPWQPEQGRVDNLPLSGVVERSLKTLLSVRFDPNRRVRLGVSAGWSRVRNYGHLQGKSVEGGHGSLLLRLQW